MHAATVHCSLCANKLLPESAYRTNFSCETALVKLHNDILWSMEQQRITAIIAIDLSAAFDTVDHDILLDVLHNQFGIWETALAWYDSYLRPRSLKVNVSSAYSTPPYHWLFRCLKGHVQVQCFTLGMLALLRKLCQLVSTSMVMQMITR